jgi:hypothetical protein
MKERQRGERDLESLNGVIPELKDFAAKNRRTLQDQTTQLKSLETGK